MKFKLCIRTLLVTAISLIISNITLSKNKEIPFMRNGISFSIAEGWKVIANDSIGDNAYYFSAERMTPKATGLITITWANKIEEPQKAITALQQRMRDANLYRNPGIEFSETIPGYFAGIKVQSCNYATIVKGQKIDGIIYCFNSAQKTISIFFQTGPEDHKLNQKAFELFQKTFNCRE